MLVGGVAEDEVDDDLEAEPVRPREQCIEILVRAEKQVDGAVIGDVVAEIPHGRREEGRNPDRVDAERGDVFEARRDPGEIADAVVVAVLKASGVDLIDDGPAPPFRHADLQNPPPRLGFRSR